MTFLVLTLLPQAFAYNPTWSELKDENGWTIQETIKTEIGDVVVSKKVIDAFPCFRGVTQYPKPLPVSMMIDIAADAESAIEWSSADVSDAKNLRRTTEYVDYWQYLDVPVFSDRMWFLRGYFEQDGDAYLFRWDNLDQGGPHKDFYDQKVKQYPNAEMTPINLGAWRIENKDNGTHVDYRLCSHPGGSVPPMLQSIATESTLPNNLRDIILETHRRMESTK